MLKRHVYFIALLSWLTLVTWLSLSSFSEMDLGNSWLQIPHMDKLVHFTFYFGVSVLGSLFLREITKGAISIWKAILSATVFAVVYGIIIEVLQLKITLNREGDMLDAIANSLGALIGAGIVKIMFSKKMPLKWSN